MTRRHKFFVAFCTTGLVLVGCGVTCWYVLDHDSPHNQASAIEAVREWARLAPLPESATGLDIQTTGTMFTREFNIEFTAPAADILAWLEKSPGPSAAKLRQDPDGTVIYEIDAGGGAQFAEVRVLKNGTIVRIKAFWS